MSPMLHATRLSLSVLIVTTLAAADASAQNPGGAEVDVTTGTTLHLQGSRAVVALTDRGRLLSADSGEHTTLPSIGMTVSQWNGAVGRFFDFSFVDGGHAEAGIGSIASSAVSSSTLDFHSGFQLQRRSPRLRPFVRVGAGFARSTTEAALAVGGDSFQGKESVWFTSVIYGGGVRIGLTPSIGLNIGLDGITATPIRSDSNATTTSYGRLMFGLSYIGR